MNSGPVWPLSARVCRTREPTYIALIEQVNAEKTNMALKKCAATGMPASTTAIINIERPLTDCALPLMKGWSLGTTNEADSTAKEYRVIIRSEIFRAAIFI